MPTEPIKNLLTRKIEKSELEKLLSEFASGIEEAVNFGTNMIPWCFEKDTRFIDSVPPILMLRNIIELGDTISILVKNSSIEPCKIILRTLLESCLGFEYLLEKDTKKRSMAFMVCYYYNEIKKEKKGEPSLPEGEKFQKLLEKDIYLKNMKLESDPNRINIIDNLQQVLKKPEFLDAVNEYSQFIKNSKKKNKKPKKPVWYALYSGPQNMQKLAELLNHDAIYEILYRSWSESTHGVNIIEGKVFPDGIIQLRSPKDTKQIVIHTLNLLIMAYTVFINNFIPEKKTIFGVWYKNEIRDFYLGIEKR
jgi:hypothetical protein